MQSNEIKSSEATSCDFSARPNDSRCRYWAKIVRKGEPLPLPASVSGANGVPGEYLRPGDEELFEGDLAFEGEARHHRKQRGWDYNLFIVRNGELVSLASDANRDVKAKLREMGETDLLPGSGEVAALVRRAHLYRLTGE
jgi:hypothetical protein